jgi:predicted nuclease with TOPRIM domain
MADAVFNGKRFATVLWGYDREQVDELVAEYETWGEHLASNLEKAESQVGESTRHVRALQAKVSKLEERAGETPPDSVRSFAGRLEQIIDDAWTAGRTLRQHCASEVASDHQKAKESAEEVVDAAEARAGQIGADAEQDRQQAARELSAAREQAERMLEQGEAAADERAQRAWDEAQARLREPQLELERLEEQRQRALEELTRLRGSLEGLVGAA